MMDFSITFPCCHAVDALQVTLRSIQARTCVDWEVICVDDGSNGAMSGMMLRDTSGDPRITPRLFALYI
jgi:hypothetical protein